MFRRMTNLFEGRPESIDERQVFTMFGVSASPMGACEEEFSVDAEGLTNEVRGTLDALNLYDGSEALRRCRYLADMMSSAKAVSRIGDRTLIRLNRRSYLEPESYIEESLERLALMREPLTARFAPLCVEYNLYGVHFIDHILGAKVYYKAGQWNAEYLKTPIGELEMPDLDKSEAWQLAKRAAEAFIDADVSLPLFGMPILSSPLNIIVNLYGQEALIAMMEDEEAARHDLDVIITLIRTLHKWYREHIPYRQLQGTVAVTRTQPPGHGQLCGCTTQLLSADMYREFIMPLDNALLADYPLGGMIHLCGGHTQHIKVFRDMPALKVVQLNDRAAGDLKYYVEGLRPDQIIYLNPCPEMPIEEAVRISGGKRIVIVEQCEPPLMPDSQLKT
ncbi:MAG: hypothetical protein IJJ23_00645 [Clostridia bacterium]|nr:hypothetical protein [Clostridia bacterium]